MPFTIRYQFSQNFNVPAELAFEWCTDFQADDPKIMAEDNASREVTKLTSTAIVLKEIFQNGKEAVVKEKLVQLYPQRLTWISTHLSGPNKYSQFLYEIVAETAGSSRLEFTAQHLEHGKSQSPEDIVKLEDTLRNYDAYVWKLLAAAMEKELTK